MGIVADSSGEYLEPFLEWLLAEALPGIIGHIADFVVGVASVISWFIQFGIVQKIITGLVVAIGALIAIKTVWVVITGVLGGAMTVLATAFAVLTSPIFLVVAAIAAVIAIAVLLVKHWDTIAAFFKDLWDRVVETFQALWDSIVELFTPVIEFFQGIFESAFEIKRHRRTALRRRFFVKRITRTGRTRRRRHFRP